MYCGDPYSSKCDSDNSKLVNKLSENQGSESVSVKQSLVLDGEKGELVKTSNNVLGKKIAVSEAKAKSALKSHSDAERRRRERINAHLATLRGLVPSNEKMDKATLLAQVILKLNLLKKAARQASENQNIPVDTDEIQVGKHENNGGDGTFMIKASLCCEYRPDLLSNIKEAINELPLQLSKCEISTLGSRVRTVIFATTTGSNSGEELILSSIRASLENILDKVSASADYSEQLIYPLKRQRTPHRDSSSSSS